MSIDINNNCAARFASLATPKENERIEAISTPFTRNNRPILLGKRHQGHLIALFPCKFEEFQGLDPVIKLSNGFELKHETLENPEKNEKLYFFELGNISNVDHVFFGAFLDELLVQIDQNSSSLESEIRTLLDRWKNLLSLDLERKLSVQELIGLFGELIILKHLISSQGTKMFEKWVGPLGNRHDFEFEKNSIEVKTSASRNVDEIHINGFDQLNPYQGKRLSIVRIKVETEPNGLSVPYLIRTLVGELKIQSFQMYEKLSKLGYHVEHEQSYENIRFQVTNIGIIPVNEQFPKISKSVISQVDPNNRINEISYRLNIAGLAEKESQNISELGIEELMK